MPHLMIPSISILRHTTPASVILRRISSINPQTNSSDVFFSSRNNNRNNKNNKNNKNKFQPNKNLLKAREAVGNLSSLSSALSMEHTPNLSSHQAIGMVASAQANFMRVIVLYSNNTPASIGLELLCVVRALLKKIKRRVSVGDKVLVSSIDWVDGRGMIENVFQRKSQILDPPVANVDHLLVFFSLQQPKLDPFSLTRFLVEAESTGIPITLVLNKMELVDDLVLSTSSSSFFFPITFILPTVQNLET